MKRCRRLPASVCFVANRWHVTFFFDSRTQTIAWMFYLSHSSFLFQEVTYNQSLCGLLCSALAVYVIAITLFCSSSGGCGSFQTMCTCSLCKIQIYTGAACAGGQACSTLYLLLQLCVVQKLLGWTQMPEVAQCYYFRSTFSLMQSVCLICTGLCSPNTAKTAANNLIRADVMICYRQAESLHGAQHQTIATKTCKFNQNEISVDGIAGD